MSSIISWISFFLIFFNSSVFEFADSFFFELSDDKIYSFMWCINSFFWSSLIWIEFSIFLIIPRRQLSMSLFWLLNKQSFETRPFFERLETSIYFKIFTKSFESFTSLNREITESYLDKSLWVFIKGGVFERHFYIAIFIFF